MFAGLFILICVIILGAIEIAFGVVGGLIAYCVTIVKEFIDDCRSQDRPFLYFLGRVFYFIRKVIHWAGCIALAFIIAALINYLFEKYIQAHPPATKFWKIVFWRP